MTVLIQKIIFVQTEDKTAISDLKQRKRKEQTAAEDTGAPRSPTSDPAAVRMQKNTQRLLRLETQ